MDFHPMSPEEMQRMMQFLLKQQAQFDANQAQFDASQAKFDANQARFDASLQALSAKTDRIAEGLIGLTGLVGRAIGDLAAAQQRTDEQLRETDARLRETDARLTKNIDRVESHLNVVIGMFERHLRDDHGKTAS